MHSLYTCRDCSNHVFLKGKSCLRCQQHIQKCNTISQIHVLLPEPDSTLAQLCIQPNFEFSRMASHQKYRRTGSNYTCMCARKKTFWQTQISSGQSANSRSLMKTGLDGLSCQWHKLDSLCKTQFGTSQNSTAA